RRRSACGCRRAATPSDDPRNPKSSMTDACMPGVKRHQVRGEMVCALHPWSWFDRQHTETQLCLHHVHRREGSICEHFWHAALRLPRIGGETECYAAARLKGTSHLSQPSPGVWPHLHGVNRQSFIEGLVCKRQALHRAVSHIDPTTLDGLRIP